MKGEMPEGAYEFDADALLICVKALTVTLLPIAEETGKAEPVWLSIKDLHLIFISLY